MRGNAYRKIVEREMYCRSKCKGNCSGISVAFSDLERLSVASDSLYVCKTAIA